MTAKQSMTTVEDIFITSTDTSFTVHFYIILQHRPITWSNMLWKTKETSIIPTFSEHNGLTSSSSVGATTLGGIWPALWFRSTIFYLYTSLSSFSLSSSLNPLLLDQAISILVFLLLLMNMVPIQLIFWQFLLYPFWLCVLPNVIFVTL